MAEGGRGEGEMGGGVVEWEYASSFDPQIIEMGSFPILPSFVDSLFMKLTGNTINFLRIVSFHHYVIVLFAW